MCGSCIYPNHCHDHVSYHCQPETCYRNHFLTVRSTCNKHCITSLRSERQRAAVCADATCLMINLLIIRLHAGPLKSDPFQGSLFCFSARPWISRENKLTYWTAVAGSTERCRGLLSVANLGFQEVKFTYDTQNQIHELIGTFSLRKVYWLQILAFLVCLFCLHDLCPKLTNRNVNCVK